MLSMQQITLSSPKFFQWAAQRRLTEQDMGYAVHSLLCDLYGDLRPRPFKAEHKGSIVKILGYGEATSGDLYAARTQTAEPDAVGCLAREEESKSLPVSWAAGTRLGFTVRVAATERELNDAGKRVEKDAFLFRPELGREAVYHDWLKRRMERAVELEHVDLTGFKLTTTTRRGAPDLLGKRSSRGIVVPEVHFEGVLLVKDPEAFSELLARGVGRHGGFGFGMLLLRPATARRHQ